MGTVLTLQSSAAGAIIVATSPGTQQLPPYRIVESMLVTLQPIHNSCSTYYLVLISTGGVEYCLSPILDGDQRPVPMSVNITNTTITVRWDKVPLPPVCDGVVVSRLPLTYSITVETNGIDLPEYPMVSAIYHYIIITSCLKTLTV